MRQKFKKISAIAASVLMVGMSIGGAFAASTATTSFPNSFTNSNVAIVYGASAASSDQTAANAIDAYLTPKMSKTSGTSVTGGEVFTIEKTNDKFYLGETFADAYSSALDEEDLATFLAEGKYKDGDVDTDYTQSIDLGDDVKLSYFKNSNYKSNEPTLGFHFEDGDELLTYTIDFEDAVTPSKMDDTEMPLLGSEYYVLNASTTEIVLLDSAEKTTMKYGETATVNGHEVKVNYISGGTTPSVKFVVDGKTLTSLEEGDDYELSDGSYIVVTDILTSSKESVDDSVEFSIGKGKITLTDGKEVKMGDTTIKGLFADIGVSGSDIDSISLTWKSYRNTFLTEESPLLMPGFEKIQVVFDGLAFPEEPETITLNADDVLTLDMGNFDLELLAFDGSTPVVGGSADNLLKLDTSDANETTNASSQWKVVDNAYFYSNSSNKTSGSWFNVTGLPVVEGDRFILTTYSSSGDNELDEVDQSYYEVDTIDYTDTNNYKVVLKDLIGSKDLEYTTLRERTNGDIAIRLAGVGEDSSSEGVAYLVFGDKVKTYDVAISKNGLYVDLSELADDFDSSTDQITFHEADKDGNLKSPSSFTVNLSKNTGDDKFYVSAINVSTEYSPSNKDVEVGYVESALATKVTFDKSGDDDENQFTIEYYGEEVPATVKLVAGGSVSSSESGAQVVVLKDTEVSSTESRNLIVVGGSCINTVAQKLLGVTSPLCGEQFTAKTKVGPGQFLIENFNSPYSNGKYALLVAGYDAADTTKAATYLTTSASSLDLTAGQPHVVSSSTVVTTTSQ